MDKPEFGLSGIEHYRRRLVSRIGPLCGSEQSFPTSSVPWFLTHFLESSIPNYEEGFVDAHPRMYGLRQRRDSLRLGRCGAEGSEAFLTTATATPYSYQQFIRLQAKELEGGNEQATQQTEPN